jgi:hypothetical protein
MRQIGSFSSQLAKSLSCASFALGLLVVFGLGTNAMAQVNTGGGVNGSATGSVIGDGGTVISGTDVGIAGNVNGSQISNINNNLQSGSNTNTIGNTVYVPTVASSGGGNGGNSMMIMPRNPLSLQNAALGRSNFGLQFGVNNNPGLSALTGGGSGMGWFMQGGLNIPFGKIPDVIRNQSGSQLDATRRAMMEDDRDVFGTLQKRNTAAQPNQRVEANVSGKVTGLSAYNFASIPSSKLDLPSAIPGLAGDLKITPQPKVLAMAVGSVFDKPIDSSRKVGALDIGVEYPYLGHLRSGWVKVLLPTGVEGWANSQFEYIKNDFTQVDGLALDLSLQPKASAANHAVTASALGAPRAN